MYEKKQLVKSTLIVIGFWSIFFSIFEIGKYGIHEFAPTLIAMLGCGVAVWFAIILANEERNFSDRKNWINTSKFLKQSMRMLGDRKPIVNFGVWNKSLYESHKPDEVSWNVLDKVRTDVKGVYRELFDEILSVFAGNQTVPAFIIPSDRETEFKKQSQYINYEISIEQENGNDAVVKVLQEKLSALHQNTFEHDGRSLIKHSLLVLACAQKIVQYGEDPLKWPSFRRWALPFTQDAYSVDPLIYICAFAHDIGKITAYSSQSKSIVDHDRMGAAIVASLTTYLENNKLTNRDRLILDVVLGNYHSPYRVNIHKSGDSIRVLDNRIHRALEIVILADKMAGKIEQKAYADTQSAVITELEWQELVIKQIGDVRASDTKTLSDKEKIALSERVIGAFVSHLETVKFNEPEQADAIMQMDYEIGFPVCLVRTNQMISEIEKSAGEVIFDAYPQKEMFYTELLAREGKIIHPYGVPNFKTTWAWKFDVYERESFINEDSGDIAWGNMKNIEPTKVQDGAFWMVDPESFGFGLKLVKEENNFYYLLNGGIGNGNSSAWVQTRKQIDQSRLLKQGENPLASAQTNGVNVVPAQTKEPSAERDMYSKLKDIKPRLGRGQKSDENLLIASGITLNDVQSLSQDEQLILGVSVSNGKLIVSR